MNKREVRLFVNKHKSSIGFGNYDLVVSDTTEDSDTVASINVIPEYLKLEVFLHKLFYKRTKQEQEEDLLHELIHGRFALMRCKVDKIFDAEEESCANDCTRLVRDK